MAWRASLKIRTYFNSRPIRSSRESLSRRTTSMAGHIVNFAKYTLTNSRIINLMLNLLQIPAHTELTGLQEEVAGPIFRRGMWGLQLKRRNVRIFDPVLDFLQINVMVQVILLLTWMQTFLQFNLGFPAHMELTGQRNQQYRSSNKTSCISSKSRHNYFLPFQGEILNIQISKLADIQSYHQFMQDFHEN